MARKLLGYSAANAARIKRAVRLVENTRRKLIGGETEDNSDVTRQWVELVAEGTGVDAGWYSYKVVAFDGTTWADYPPDDPVDSGGGFWAREINGLTGLAGQRVEIQFAGYQEDDDSTPAVLFQVATGNQPIIHIHSDAGGSGQYIGRRMLLPTGTWDSTTSGGGLGSEDTGDVLLVNLQEYFNSPATHWLTNTDNEDQQYFTADRAGYTDEAGRQVYFVNAIWVQTCVPPG